jgi:DNA repair protein RecO (recombination protein O)
MPTGEALLSGYYLNELLLRLLARDDPHPSLFDVYRQTVHVLAGGVSSTTAPALRAFELLLLQDVGLLPALDMQTMSLQPLDENTLYELVPEGGLRSLPHDDAHQRHALPGLQWQSLQAAMDSSMPFTATLRMCAEWPAEWRSQLQAQLRALLHVHCGVGSLRTRQIMMDIQSL